MLTMDAEERPKVEAVEFLPMAKITCWRTVSATGGGLPRQAALLEGSTSRSSPKPAAARLPLLLLFSKGTCQYKWSSSVELRSATSQVHNEHDPSNDVLTSAVRVEARKHAKYDANSAATGRSSLETTAAR